MKTMRLFFAVLLFFCTNAILSAQTERVWTEKYNGEEYTIQENRFYYVIVNKKFILSCGFMTMDDLFEEEDLLDYAKRRKDLCKAICWITNGVFHFDRLYTSEACMVVVSCTFDVQTKDYTGALMLSFDKEIKDYATLEKVSLLEKALLESGLNAGKTKVLDPNEKYFMIEGYDCTLKKK